MLEADRSPELMVGGWRALSRETREALRAVGGEGWCRCHMEKWWSVW